MIKQIKKYQYSKFDNKIKMFGKNSLFGIPNNFKNRKIGNVIIV